MVCMKSNMFLEGHFYSITGLEHGFTWKGLEGLADLNV